MDELIARVIGELSKTIEYAGEGHGDDLNPDKARDILRAAFAEVRRETQRETEDYERRRYGARFQIELGEAAQFKERYFALLEQVADAKASSLPPPILVVPAVSAALLPPAAEEESK